MALLSHSLLNSLNLKRPLSSALNRKLRRNTGRPTWQRPRQWNAFSRNVLFSNYALRTAAASSRHAEHGR
jgi:hypothetical protein